jgi:hypothetical protein
MFSIKKSFDSIFQMKIKFDDEFCINIDFDKMSFLLSIECSSQIIIYIHHQLFHSLINLLLKDFHILIDQS